jgi:hypothetical protein
MKILASIPKPLRGRGHNECTPMECPVCKVQQLFPLSDGLRSDGDLDDATKTVPVKCVGCFAAYEVPVTELTSHNGQAQ